MKVICKKANNFEACKGCIHSEPHEKVYLDEIEESCTNWGICWTGKEEISVRCININSKSAKKLMGDK